MTMIVAPWMPLSCSNTLGTTLSEAYLLGIQTANQDIRCLLLVKYHSEVGLLADKYNVPDLRELASLRAKQIAIQYLPAARV